MPERPRPERPRIALLVPCYNGAAHVASFLSSLDALDPGFDEVLFVDDASTDDSVDLLRDAGHRVIALPANRGAAAARNRLWQESTSDYVHFHDIDDPFSRSDLLAVLAPNLEGGTVVFGATEFVEQDGTTTIRPTQPDLLPREPARFVLNDVVHLNAVLWPRPVLERIGGFRSDLRTHEDIMLFIDAHAQGATLTYIDAVVARHIKHPDSTLQKKARWEHDLQALEVCRLAAEALRPSEADLVAQKAVYHLRRLALAGQPNAASDAARRLRPLLRRGWGQGGRLERVLARFFGHSVALRYLARGKPA